MTRARRRAADTERPAPVCAAPDAGRSEEAEREKRVPERMRELAYSRDRESAEGEHENEARPRDVVYAASKRRRRRISKHSAEATPSALQKSRTGAAGSQSEAFEKVSSRSAHASAPRAWYSSADSNFANGDRQKCTCFEARPKARACGAVPLGKAHTREKISRYRISERERERDLGRLVADCDRAD